MDIKHLQFSFRMYWANMKGLLNMVAEGIILVASLASLFILVYQFDSNIRPMSPICWKPAGFISCWLSLPGYRSGIF